MRSIQVAPTAARTDVTFWLSTPATTPLIIPSPTRVATLRAEDQEPVVFSTLRALEIFPVELLTVAIREHDADGMRPRLEQLKTEFLSRVDR